MFLLAHAIYLLFGFHIFFFTRISSFVFFFYFNTVNHNKTSHRQITSIPNVAISIAPIRIVDGFTKYSGRIEVYHENKWGPICSAGWGMKEANVACRQLHYAKAASAKGIATFKSTTLY